MVVTGVAAAAWLGSLGPAWLMHAPAEVSEAEGKRWIWAVFHIEVE